LINLLKVIIFIIKKMTDSKPSTTIAT